MKNKELEYLAQLVVYCLENASADAVREVISHLDKIWNALYDESEELERLDVVVDLEPDQRKRAADLESMLGILCSMINLCYEVLPKEDDKEVYTLTDSYTKGCRDSIRKEGAEDA